MCCSLRYGMNHQFLQNRDKIYYIIEGASVLISIRVGLVGKLLSKHPWLQLDCGTRLGSFLACGNVAIYSEVHECGVVAILA